MTKAIYTTTKAGRTETRTSAGHTEAKYKFAVWVRNHEGLWYVTCFNSRFDLAEKERSRRISGRLTRDDIAIEPVTCEIKQVKAKPVVAFPGGTFSLFGVVFMVDPQWPTTRIGEYRGYQITLRCTGTAFTAGASKDSRHDPNYWATTVNASAGNLITRVALIKRLIDAKLDQLSKVEG